MENGEWRVESGEWRVERDNSKGIKTKKVSNVFETFYLNQINLNT